MRISLFLLCLSLMGCAAMMEQMNQVGGGSLIPSQADTVAGLKGALEKGILTGSSLASKVDGYYKNPKIKIPFPQEALKAEKTLRSLGLGKVADEAILSFNRAAEGAAKEAAPVFVAAIKQMTITDAMNILLGPDDAATSYLKKTTSAELRKKFEPVAAKSLDSALVTKYWTTVMDQYNKIPFTKPVTTNINEYVTDQALNGLFYMVSQEESKIRANPAERTTAILQKVFGYADTQKAAKASN